MTNASTPLDPPTTPHPEEVALEEVVAALEQAAFTIGEGNDDAGRRIIHTYAGPFGADWDVAEAVEFVRAAEHVYWARSVFQHDLVAVSNGRVVSFNVPSPSRSSR